RRGGCAIKKMQRSHQNSRRRGGVDQVQFNSLDQHHPGRSNKVASHFFLVSRPPSSAEEGTLSSTCNPFTPSYTAPTVGRMSRSEDLKHGESHRTQLVVSRLAARCVLSRSHVGFLSSPVYS